MSKACVSRLRAQLTADSLAHHGVLAHQHNSQTAHRNTDLLHLTGSNVVGADDEAFWIFVQVRLKV
jgi:hypothetical protein